MKKSFIFAIAFAFCLSFLPSLLHAQSNKVVKSIEVVGNNSIGITTILAKIKTRVGQDYRQNIISDDLKRLYNTGYFSDVSVDREDFEGGLKVIIHVMEKPIVEEITFSKVKYFKKRALLKKLKTKDGKFLDKKTLNDDINTIKDMYSKKGLTQVTVDVESFVDEVTNKASLHFIIREGYRVKVKRINVFGNTAYKDKKLIRVIKSRPAWLFNSGYLQEDVVREDMSRIESFYAQNGYIDARADFTLDRLQQGRVNININIDEGRRYYVGDVAIVGNAILTDREVTKAMKETTAGGVYSREKLEADVSEISSLYFDKGYIFAKVEDSTSLNPDSGKVDILVDIQEGGVAYINKIKIQGNTRTKDLVIRRELKMYPGDQFDGKKLKRSKERLRSLGYFEDVTFDMEETNYPDRRNLLVQVKEAKTGSFSFGGGYSTVDEVVGFVEIEQRNFDIGNWPSFTGGGQHLSVRAETGSTRNNLRLSFTEPWMFDYPISGGFDLYRTERDREQDIGYAYDETRTGGNIRFGKEVGENLHATVNYRLEEIEISNVADGVSAALLAEAGENTVSSIGFSLTKDERDSFISPTDGWQLGWSTQVAGGPLGGDKDFYKFQTHGNYYIPLKWDSVLEFRARAGIVDAYGDSSRVPIFERFFAGGSKSIRGYDERDIGPKDTATKDPIGGEAIFVGNIEYTIPVIEVIKVAFFFDTGNVWTTVSDYGEGGLESGAGLGLRVKTPIGPVNLDYGWPLDNLEGEEDDDNKDGKFYFSISRGF